MNQDIFLIAPHDLGAAETAAKLQEALAATKVAAVLLPRGDLDDEVYAEMCRPLVPLIQKAGAAVLLQNAPDLVVPLGADGVHMTGSSNSFAAALKALKPDFIVGTGELRTRHDAMSRGEAGADYMFFGDIAADQPDETAVEEALWWAETFEVPCALYAGGGWDEAMAKCEFAGLGGPAIWTAPEGPAAALIALADKSAVSV